MGIMLALDREKKVQGLKALWISPVRALCREIADSLQDAADHFDQGWTVEVRTGDTDTKTRQRQKKSPPQILVTTPESLHLILASKGYEQFFKGMIALVADEWHELMGSKRGVLLELGLSRLRTICPKLRVWAISATIGNLDTAMDVLLGPKTEYTLVRSDVPKPLEIITLYPDETERLPWAGHLGIRLLEQVLEVIRKSRTTIIFTNTRSQSEIWYQKLLDADPDLSGVLAMHHGSLSRELREWVEDALDEGSIKAVVSTSSLDLGVDFRPVESVVQIGSPKGVARFLQRAGRSGHRPGATSRIHFLPTNALELIESAALREAVKQGVAEDRQPFIRSFDVLLQYLTTLAVSDGFRPEQVYEEIRQTHCFATITDDEWDWCLKFLVNGGDALRAYDEFRKVEVDDGLYQVKSRRVAMRHRMSIGAIIRDAAMHIKFKSGKRLGTVEEWFISQLVPGDHFWFAGRCLELLEIRDMDVIVANSNKGKGKVPSWMGGRMPLSSNLTKVLRDEIEKSARGSSEYEEIQRIQPLIDLQKERSAFPAADEFLIETYESDEGHHLFVYPFEGRLVHEAMAALLGYRIGLLQPISFSMAYNDYGFELLSDQEIPLVSALENNLFTTEHLMDDLYASINSAELARRAFRDISGISGIVFSGYPGSRKKERHLQSSASLFFEVFRDYDPDNLLFRQAYDEVFEHLVELPRLFEALTRIGLSNWVIKTIEQPTPLSFPILVDRLRESTSSERLEDRIKRMQLVFG